VLLVFHPLTRIYDSNKYKETRRVKDVGWKAIILYYISWGEVRLNPLGIWAIGGPIPPAPALKNEDRQWKPMCSNKTCLGHLVHHKFHKTQPGIKPGAPQWEVSHLESHLEDDGQTEWSR
jgi:hypothetical protein